MKQLVPHHEKEEPLPSGVRDIDAGEDDDPTLVSCYARPVYKHLMEVEVRSEATTLNSAGTSTAAQC